MQPGGIELARSQAPPVSSGPQLLHSDAPIDVRRLANPRVDPAAGPVAPTAGSTDPGVRKSALSPRANGMSSPGAEGTRRGTWRVAGFWHGVWIRFWLGPWLEVALMLHAAGFDAARSGGEAVSCAGGAALAPLLPQQEIEALLDEQACASESVRM